MLYQKLIAPGGVAAARRELAALERAVVVVEEAFRTNCSTGAVIDAIAVALEEDINGDRSQEEVAHR